MERELRELGATLVVTAAECKAALKDSGLPAPKLALDCVAGERGRAAGAGGLESGGGKAVGALCR